MDFSSDRSIDEKKTMFLASLRMAMADGHLDPSEFSWCMLIAKRIGLTESEVSSVIENPEAVNFTIPESKRERALNLIELIFVSKSDGEVAAEELKVLAAFAIIYGFSADQMTSIIAQMNHGGEIGEIIASVC
jgi:uncharacterized tellurite resistance protein B-like protein